MPSYRRLGYGTFRTAAALALFGFAIFGAGPALAAQQYDLTCDDCHTMPPLDSANGKRDPGTGAVKGNHQSHAGATSITCVKCHGAAVTDYATGHRTKAIQVTGNLNASPAGASYSRAAAGTFFNQTSVPPNPLGTCSNVNCHFEARTPEWGSPRLLASDPANCSACHNALPDSGAHARHVAHYGNDVDVCAKCHPDHTADPEPFGHASSAGHPGRTIRVNVGSYTGSNFQYLPSQAATRTVGSCSTLYCHSPGQSAIGGALTSGDYSTPNWGNPSSGGCGSCHATTALTTGSHARHIASDSNCSNCHVNATPSAYSAPSHVDGVVDVGLGAYDKGGAPGNGYGSCSAAACHASPYGTGSITSPIWGTASGCAACHSGIGAFGQDGAPQTGSHQAHLALNGVACNQCHDGAVKGTSGGDSHANGTVEVANDYSGTPVTKHAPGSYTGTCSSASCHASPYGNGFVVSPVWGTKAGCASCHNGDGTFIVSGAPATGSHARHLALNGVTCSPCHPGAVSGVSGGNTHTNGTVEVGYGYTDSPVAKHPIGTYTGTCSTAYCHSDGNGAQVPTPKWGVALSSTCGACHGGSAAGGTPIATGKHRSHMNNYSTLGRSNNLMCGECHAKTVSVATNAEIANQANHLNGFKDYSGVKAGGSASYDSGTGVCATAYCHSSGQAKPVFVSMTGSKSWRGSAKLDCSGCHGRAAAASWSALGAPNYPNRYDGTQATANSHEKHVAGAELADSRGCARCHLSTVDRSVPGKMRDYSSAHTNGSREVAFALSGGYQADAKSCTTYCHSNVQAPGGNGPATAFAAPTWGNNGSTTCASCHKDMSQLTESAEDLQLGSHKRHTVDAGYACSLCHGAGYAATSTRGATHADGSIDIALTGKGAGTSYSQPADNTPGNGYGTCSASKCHGRGTKNWGNNSAAPTCEKCHGSANTAITDRTFKDTAGSASSNYAGTHVSHLAGSHNFTAPIQCSECHVVPASPSSFGHMSSLPARVQWGTLATGASIVRGGSGAPMIPGYDPATRTCNNTYCHAGVQIKDQVSGTVSYEGANPSPRWGDPGYLGGTGCDRCHGYPPKGTHTTSTNCSACHSHVDQSNLSFADKSKHLNGQVEVTVDECLGCHSSLNLCQEGDPKCINKELIGAHKNHTNAELFLAGKKLSNNDFIDSSWIYGIIYKDGFPQFGCGFCHPMDIASHKNGVIDLDLDPAHAARGSVKTMNLAGGPWTVSRTPGSSVVCSNVYCHSSGYVSETTNTYQFQTTPDWYASNPWGALDKCAQCHGNSPNTGGREGSPAHARHVVANHYKDVFDGFSSALPRAGAPGSGAVHGDPATATTFNCNICHYDTVREARNDKGSACSGCHSSAPKGIMNLYSSGQAHINGHVDVVFLEPFAVKSKAQLKDNIASVQSVYSSWTRFSGYKTYSSYDMAKTKPVYLGGTCSTVACHNGTQMEWRTKGPLDCAACHTGLPQ